MPHIVHILPRNMHFGAEGATSIDLCVRDIAAATRYAAGVSILCQRIEAPFAGFDIHAYEGGTTRHRLSSIRRILRSLCPDLVVVHQHLPTAAALARTTRAPVLLHRHNFTRPRRGISRGVHAFRHRRLAGVIFVSETCAAAFRRDYPGVTAPVHAVPNALDPADWKPAEKSDTIVHIGRLVPAKGALEVAEALARVLPDHPGWRGRLVGPPSGDATYDAAIAEVVAGCDALTLDGALAFEDMARIARCARIAVVNSRAEAFGRVAIEAYAAQAALVSTRVGGLAEIVSAETAVPLETGETDEIAAVLRGLLDDPGRVAQLAQAGRARFEAVYTLDQAVSKLDAIYAATLAAHDT